ncbi:MAG: DUF3488 and transglutaminase-like domain-containing protein, partial [Planctomycetota bacterium]
AAITVLAFAAWLTDGPIRLDPARWVINTFVVLAGLIALQRWLSRGPSVSEFGLFLIIVGLIKLLDRKRPRDDAQLLLLALFLSLGAMLTNVEFVVGVLLVLQITLLIVSAMLYQLSSERWRIEKQGGSVAAPLSTLAAWSRLRAWTVSVVIAMFVFAAFVFVTVPRAPLGNRLGALGSPSVGQVSGFNDSVQLGTGGLISTSPTPVLDLRIFNGSTGEPAGATGRVVYLRGAVLEDYDAENNRWSERTVSGNDERLVRGERRLLAREQADDIRQEISLRDAADGPARLFAAWKPVEVTVGDTVDAFRKADDSLVLGAELNGGRFRYEVRSRTGTPSLTFDEPRPIVSFPSQLIANQAAQVLQGADVEPDPALRPREDDARGARAIQQWLQRNFAYTLELPPTPPNVMPEEWFLQTAQRGHCEYFASVMAAMCRTVGIPARVVTGYVAADYNATSSHYVVRESNAHAWVEVMIADDAWATFDPTPPADLELIHGTPEGFGPRLARWFDAIEYAWIRSVVSFDSQSQVELFGFGTNTVGPDLGTRSVAVQRVVRAISLAVVAAGLALFGWAVSGIVRARIKAMKLRQALLPTHGDNLAERASQARIYAEALEALVQAGLAKPDSRPPLAHAEALDERMSADQQRTISDRFRRIASAYCTIRFGGGSLNEAELQDAKRALSDLRETLRRQPKFSDAAT